VDDELGALLVGQGGPADRGTPVTLPGAVASVQPDRGSAFCTLEALGMRTVMPVVLRAPLQAWPTRNAAA
jgi:hypothetical protein